MPIPKRRTTRSSRGQRRSHDFLKKLNTTTCSKCSEPIMPHRVCLKCGSYNGQQVVEIKSAKDKSKNNKNKEPQKKQD